MGATISIGAVISLFVYGLGIVGYVKNQYFVQEISCKYFPVRDPYLIGDGKHKVMDQCLLLQSKGGTEQYKEFEKQIKIDF